jgi:hypothetical protein
MIALVKNITFAKTMGVMMLVNQLLDVLENTLKDLADNFEQLSNKL